MTRTVRDHPERHRYELEFDGGVAFIDYRRSGQLVTMTHVEVPPAYRGGGIGSTLVRGALALVREAGEKVVPLCPFVARYIDGHPEARDLRARDSGGR